MMGIVSDNDFEIELDRLGGIPPPVKIIDMNIGRGNGNKEVPESLKKIIGENAITEGSKETKVLTQALQISDSSLSAYKNGSTSTASYDSPDKELKNHVDGVRDKIINKSRARLLQAINHITKEKLEGTKARDLAGIAKDMSAVIKNLEPDDSSRNNNRPFVIYAPQFRSEQSFETLVVQE